MILDVRDAHELFGSCVVEPQFGLKLFRGTSRP